MKAICGISSDILKTSLEANLDVLCEHTPINIFDKSHSENSTESLVVENSDVIGVSVPIIESENVSVYSINKELKLSPLLNEVNFHKQSIIVYDSKPDNKKKTKKSKNQKQKNEGFVPNMNVEKCGTILISPSILDELKKGYIFNQDLPILSLSMAKRLVNSALSGSMKIIQNEIDTVEYYLKTGWNAYKSHRKKIIMKLDEHLGLQERSKLLGNIC